MAIGSNWTSSDYDALVALSAAQSPPISPTDAVFILFEEGGMNPASDPFGGNGASGMNGMTVDNLTSLGLTKSQWLTMTVQQQLAVIFKLWQSWAKTFNNGQFPSDAGMLLALNFVPGQFKNVSAGTNPNAVLVGQNGPLAQYWGSNTPLQNSTGTITVNTLRQYVANTEAKSGQAWQNVVAQVQAAQARAGQSAQVAQVQPSAWPQTVAIVLGGLAIGMAGHYTVEQHGRQIAKAFRPVTRRLAFENPVRGERVVDGRVLILVNTIPGLNAKAEAEAEAKARRARGEFVRVVRRHAYLYAVYAL